MSSGCSYPRHVRLTQKKDYQRVFSDAVACKSKYFTALAATNELGYARVGMAIAKKKARRSVDRQRIKRMVRESFRLAQSSIPHMDIVILSNAGAATATNPELRQALDSLWARLPRLLRTALPQGTAAVL